MKTILKMTDSQLRQVEGFVRKHKKFGEKFGLIGQVRLKGNEIDVALLTIKQCERLRKIFKGMGIIKK